MNRKVYYSVNRLNFFYENYIIVGKFDNKIVLFCKIGKSIFVKKIYMGGIVFIVLLSKMGFINDVFSYYCEYIVWFKYF